MQNSILKFYFQLAFENKIQEIKKSFLGNDYFKENGYTYLKAPYDYYLKEEMVVDGDEPSFIMDSIDRERFFKIQLENERSKFFDQINDTGKTLKKEDLKSILDEVKLIYEEIEFKNREDRYTSLVLEDLRKLVYRCKREFSSIINYHPVFKILKPISPTESYFQVKDLKYSFFKTLYDETIQLNLIDDIEVTENEFIDVLTSPQPTCVIRFLQPNSVVAYYLQELEDFFYNFNPVSIEKSKAFFNKGEKPFTSQDLYTALSRKNKSFGIWSMKIDKMIDNLREQHLK